MAPICRALPPLLLLCACRAGALEIVSTNVTAVPIEGGALISVRLQSPLRGARNVTCKFAWRMDSWALGATWEGRPRADDPSDVLCGPMPPLPAEGPIDILLVADNVSSNKLPLWTFATFSAAPGMTPYYGSGGGSLLVRVNDSGLPAGGGGARGGGERAYELTAVTADASTVLLDRAQVLGGDVRRALPVDLGPLGAATDVQVNLSLRLPSGGVLRRQVRLLRVARARPGAVAVDHSTRGILVDGQPFFPISWMTTADSFGTAFMVTAMAQMARRGANSIMIYYLGDVGAEARLSDAGPKVLDESEVSQMMDAAQALGLKVQLHVIKMVDPIAKTGGSKDDWDRLEGFVLRWRSHPALLAWYVADDFSGPYLPKVYDRLKELDPFHLVSMAIAGLGEAWEPTYLRGADVVMPENYPLDPRVGWDTLHILSYFPYDWSPRVNCAMAWAEQVKSTAMFRVELYNGIAAGATGVIWFAHRTLPGEWNEPGPLFDASGVLGRELLDLVPSALVTETTAGAGGAPAQPSLAAISGVTQDGRTALVHATARREASGCVHLILVNNENEPVTATVRFARPTAGIYEPGSLHRAAGTVPFEQPLPGRARLVAVVNGSVSESLPSFGTQVFRFNGTSGCAGPLAGQAGEGHNLVANPSFEESRSYAAAPDAWSCDASVALDRACFADASTAREGRRSGRFATGAGFGSFRIRVPVMLDRARAGQVYNFSAWVRGDVAGQTVSLRRVRAEGRVVFEEELASVVVGATWTHVQTLVTMPPVAHGQAPPVALAVTKPGVLWLDDVRLVLPSAPESANMLV